MRPSFKWLLALCLSILVATLGGACGGGGGSEFDNNDAGNSNDGSNHGDDSPTLGDGNLGGDGSPQGMLSIEPADKVVDVTFGQPPPTVQYIAKVGGQPVSASFSIDRGEIGAIVAGSGLLTPTGTLGGKATVTANYQGSMASTSVTVHLHVNQNGDPNAGDGGTGVGGNGGVGGEGPGPMIDPGTQGVLDGQPMTDTGLAWLYPYDQTVWPRGVLAPLLQWVPGAQGSYDAIKIHITEASFEYVGYFGKTKTPFTHHPVPQAVWKMMAYSNGGEPVNVTLVFAANGKAWGPITESWKVANGTLKGTVYYNSYGTNLAHNFCCALNGAKFGAATLAIKSGATDPVLIAGNDTDCRVCHSVAANGSTLVTQHGDNYAVSSAYALTNNNAETPMPGASSTYAFPALYPDGTFLLSNSAPLPGTGNTAPTALYSVPSGAAVAGVTGIPAGLRAGCPVFSADGKHVAFNNYQDNNGGVGDGISLAAMDFAAASKTFQNLATLYTPGAGNKALFPAFLPTNDAVVFELETASDGEYGATRNGSRGELWWVDLKTKTAKRLDRANGVGYLPSGANNHNADTTLNYEPTVNPVPSGGYAWVVFTSRRLYGNIATIDPYSSDPRTVDLVNNVTPKKLWVAAIDLNAPPGTDPSHPAFYLPGQELLAGNSRGYWVVDPCHPSGTSCETGDECCGGFCRIGEGGALVCMDQAPGCAQEFENCKTDADCCGNGMGITCVNGRCAMSQPR